MNVTNLANTLSAHVAGANRTPTTDGGARSSITANVLSANDAAKQALDQNGSRQIEQNQAAQRQNEVKLSQPGQLQSALANLQTASGELSETKKASTTQAAAALAAQNFVQAFNQVNKVAATSAGNDDRKVEAASSTAANDSLARTTANDLSRALSSSTAISPAPASPLDALKNIGITTNKDGSLSFDASKFGQAYQAAPQATTATLAQTGEQVGSIASRQAENNGNTANQPAAQEAQAPRQEAQQEQERTAALEQASAQINTRLDTATATHIAAYQQIFSL